MFKVQCVQWSSMMFNDNLFLNSLDYVLDLESLDRTGQKYLNEWRMMRNKQWASSLSSPWPMVVRSNHLPVLRGTHWWRELRLRYHQLYILQGTQKQTSHNTTVHAIAGKRLQLRSWKRVCQATLQKVQVVQGSSARRRDAHDGQEVLHKWHTAVDPGQYLGSKLSKSPSFQ